MRTALRHILLSLLLLLILSGCNVHEWPSPSSTVSVRLQLTFATDMILWEQHYDADNDASTSSSSTSGSLYDNRLSRGEMRYVVRAYPTDGNQQRSSRSHSEEYVFIKDITDGYDHEVHLDLPSGDYDIMVWADLSEQSGAPSLYDATHFDKIVLREGLHPGNTDYRDAFRGTGHLSLTTDCMERPAETLHIAMERPLAKYEFISGDVVEFIKKESLRIASKSNAEHRPGADLPDGSRAINIEDYRVRFYYTSHMPDSYNMFTDKLSGSTKGISYETRLRRLNSQEASMGFDYVFINGKESAVTVRIAVYDSEGTELSVTDEIEVPIKRNHHTVMSGEFLTAEAGGGITISPDYDDDHNILFTPKKKTTKNPTKE